MKILNNIILVLLLIVSFKLEPSALKLARLITPVRAMSLMPAVRVLSTMPRRIEESASRQKFVKEITACIAIGSMVSSISIANSDSDHGTLETASLYPVVTLYLYLKILIRELSSDNAKTVVLEKFDFYLLELVLYYAITQKDNIAIDFLLQLGLRDSVGDGIADRLVKQCRWDQIVYLFAHGYKNYFLELHSSKDYTKHPVDYAPIIHYKCLISARNEQFRGMYGDGMITHEFDNILISAVEEGCMDLILPAVHYAKFNTILYCLMYTVANNDNIEIFKILLQAKSELPLERQKAFLATKDERGNTLLHHAIMYDNYEAVEALLNFGADRSIRNNNGKNALDRALDLKKTDLGMKNLDKIIKLLVATTI